MRNLQYGLKLWSTNDFYIPHVKKHYEEKVFDYIELYVIPGSYHSCINQWLELDIPYILHCPHEAHNFNLSLIELRKSNEQIYSEVKKYAEKLDANSVIVHPGIGGNVDEFIKQLNNLNDERVVIENLPSISLGDEKCLGDTKDQLQYIFSFKRYKFCLDLGHALSSLYYRNESKKKIMEYFDLNPFMFHISDGIWEDKYDKHLHIGEGDYDIKFFMSMIPRDSKISVECEKNKGKNLLDFRQDVDNLRVIEQQIGIK